ncbi:O-antigen ligase like membrane protein [Geodermatophilus ruber]|uniref:O-antigen ligase like membrane protein n=2 Tax=Geodermatophilus ruber TaxID=504800 RepID=A0A1I4DH53_9ACTN|nr:O-antigen ligase like membrane protein [Geodermatophilus ruber]
MLIVKHRFDSSWPRVLMTATVAAGVTLAFLGIFVPAFREWFVRGDSESLSSLTGRTHIWQVLIEASLDRPLVGYGFGALYNEAFTGGSLLREIPGTNAHNMLLQACVETGVIGLALIVSVIFVAGRSLAKRARGPLAFTLLLLLCLNGLGSAGIATVGIAAWLLAMLVYVARSTSHPYRAHVVEEWKAR